MLAFLAHDADTRVFCYATADLRKEEQADEILQLRRLLEAAHRPCPEELIFDSKLTTYANLNRLNRAGHHFITLRRRSPAVAAAIAANSPRPGGGSNWRASRAGITDAADPGPADHAAATTTAPSGN